MHPVPRQFFLQAGREQKPTQVETSKSWELIDRCGDGLGFCWRRLYGFKSGPVPVSRGGVDFRSLEGDQKVEMAIGVYSSVPLDG